ncbi:hypothetical protein TRVA0_010S00738 [Trichomonascus vanleenenianus]|uniref:putative metalloendopeptidase n=1 Tax=Trichomonascus vanleenenianus TaxID=2268995 RepID=UPI003ECB3F3E
MSIFHKRQAQFESTSPPRVNYGSRPFMPNFKFFNISNGDTVHERIFILHGSAGPDVKNEGQQYEASILVYHHIDSFPSQRFPVVDGLFKALVHLEPGVNNLKIVFEAPPRWNMSNFSENLTINYLPLLQNPPIHLCLLLGKDSEGKFDNPKYKRDKEGNGLDLAIKKMRMAGYLMAAFTNEQMYRNKFGHRTFRLYEEWTKDTLSNRDDLLRSTAKVHILRSDRTVAQIRDPDIAQQNPKGKKKNELFAIALDALRSYGGPFTTGQEVHAAVIFVDAHWDPKAKLIVGHAALGGGAGDINLGIFGGHAIYTWPSCLEEVVSSFMDDTPTDTKEVANDSGESGSAWENCNVGMGAFMHEIGHSLGCPHQPNGIMLRDYVIWNRTFMITEPKYVTRTKKPGKRLCLPRDECIWHRLDADRFRYHPAFKLPEDPIPLITLRKAAKPIVYPVEYGAVVMGSLGIYLIEIHAGGEHQQHLEYVDEPQKQLLLTVDEIKDRVSADKQDQPIKLVILSIGEQTVEVEDFVKLMRNGRMQLGGVVAYRGNKVGYSGEGEEKVVQFPVRRPKLSGVRVYAGSAVDGVEFLFAPGESLLFGKRGGRPHDLMFREGEQLVGFYVRAGYWVDGIQVITNYQRSPVFGNASGGSGYELVPPEGYYIHGLWGNIHNWTHTIGIIYTN